MEKSKPTVNNYFYSGVGVIFACVLFVALTIIVNTLFVGWRIDATEHRLYTLSSGTNTLLQRIEEPISFKFYFSKKEMAGYPGLVNYGNRVEDLLREYADRSKGKINLEVLDPESFSELEDQAVSDGMYGLQVSDAGDKVYLGLAANNAIDVRQSIPFFQSIRESSLEYDIGKLLFNLIEKKKPTVGVLSTLPIMEDPLQRRKSIRLIAAMRDFFDVISIDVSASTLDPSVDILLLVHPKALNPKMLYSIDQFLLKGGKAMIFIDPLSEIDNPNPDPQRPNLVGRVDSNLDELMSAWDVKLVPDKIATDIRLAMRVVTQDNSSYQIDYLPWMRLGQSNINQDSLITRQLNAINLGSAGVLEHNPSGSELEFRPLLFTGDQSMKMEKDLVMLQGDPQMLLRAFNPDSGRLVIAAHLKGKSNTAYPDGLTIEGEIDEFRLNREASHLSEGELDVVLVADTDILRDVFWVKAGNFLGVEVDEPISNNADFVINAMEFLLGGDQLGDLRSRGRFERSFELVEDLRREAEAKYREREQQLQDSLRQTEQKILALQQGGGKVGDFFSKEQRVELEKFIEQRTETRKALRAVRHELRKDIESLGDRMKLINIVLFPLLVACFPVIFLLLRRRFSKSKH